MNVKIEESWKTALAPEFDKEYFVKLTDFVRGEYMSGRAVYPAPANIFNAFNLCPLDQVKVVIIGQDPYHEPGQAHGLCRRPQFRHPWLIFIGKLKTIWGGPA